MCNQYSNTVRVLYGVFVLCLLNPFVVFFCGIAALSKLLPNPPLVVAIILSLGVMTATCGYGALWFLFRARHAALDRSCVKAMGWE